MNKSNIICSGERKWLAIPNKCGFKMTNISVASSFMHIYGYQMFRHFGPNDTSGFSYGWKDIGSVIRHKTIRCNIIRITISC